MIDVQLNNEMGYACDEHAIKKVVREILIDHGYSQAEISLVIVDDPTIHKLNRTHLQHDYPTDVLSFVFDRAREKLDGEVIVSSDTATSTATQYGWSAEEELTLYFIHGTLHLVGYDDHDDEKRQTMRRSEEIYLKKLGIQAPEGHATRELQTGEAAT